MKRYLVSLWTKKSRTNKMCEFCHHDPICCKKLRPDSEVVSYEKT